MFAAPVIERPTIRWGGAKKRWPEDWERWFARISPHLKAFAPHHRKAGRWLQSIQAGEKARPRVDCWPRAHGKCLRGDAVVIRSSGRLAFLKDVQVGDRILSLNEETGKVTSGCVSRRWESGVKDLVAVRTRTGRVLHATREHQVRTFEGWKAAGDLSEGDRIASPRRINTASVEGRSEEEVRLLAYMLAEGSTSGEGFQHNSEFTNIDAVVRADFARCAFALGFWAKRRDRLSLRLGGGGKKWLRENGLAGCTTLTKRVPEWMFEQPAKNVRHFLAAFIDTDGWFSEQQAGISLANPGLVSDLRFLSLQVGLYGSVYTKENGHAGAWELVYDQSVLPDLAQLPLLVKGERAERLGSKGSVSQIDSYPNSVGRELPVGMNRRMRQAGIRMSTPCSFTRDKIRRALEVEELEQWRWLEEADVFWDEVVSIDDSAPAETFDIEVSEFHNFIADGLVVHNSTFAEHGVAYVAEQRKRSFVLYVGETQSSAEKHVENIKSLLEQIGGPVGQRLENQYGHSRGWKKSLIRTASGFNVVGLGLDVAMRGVKFEDVRPDMLVFDDFDGRHDTPHVTKKKIETITQDLIPAGSDDAVIWMVQNLITPNSIMSRLCGVSVHDADFLGRRIVCGPVKAVDGLQTERRWSEEMGRRLTFVTGGTPTWSAYSLEDAQADIQEEGERSFLREKQQDVKDVEGALWTTDLINETRLRLGEKTDIRAGTLKRSDVTRTVVSVDPATTSKTSSDETGIVGAGVVPEPVSGTLHGLLLEDKSGTYGPAEWARRAVLMHDRLGAACIVAESNQGGEMVAATLQGAAEKLWSERLRENKSVKVKLVHVHDGKRVRADPIAQRFEDGMAHVVGSLPEAEDEMTTWDGSDGSASPNRVDAAVQALTELMLGRERKAQWVNPFA